MEHGHLLAAVAALVGGVYLAGRYTLRAWSLRQLQVLARESYNLQRWWAVIDELPAELLTQPLRCSLGRVMYQRLKRAQRVQPDHPFLRTQQLQIARFIGRTPRDNGRRLTGAAREQAELALNRLITLLSESAAEGLISEQELTRCETSVSRALIGLELSHFRQAALQAEYLKRTPQAISYLRSALRSARALGEDSTVRRDIERRLTALEGAAVGHRN